MSTTAPPERRHYRSQTTLTMRATPNELPAGVCGQVEGVAMVYGVVDTHGTTFAKGCLDRTVRERVAAGKVRLFFDHGDVPMTGMYDTHLHIGVVRSVWDSTTPDGMPCAMFRADIFDTESGRSAHEYLRAIAATNAETGVSIGMLKEPDAKPCMVGDQPAMRVAEVALGEISVTSMSSVPGTRVTAVRAEAHEHASLIIGGPIPDAPTTLSNTDYLTILDGIVAHLGPSAVRAHLSATVSNAEGEHSDAATASNVSTDPDSPGVSRDATEASPPNVASYDARVAFVRANLHRLLE